MFNGSAFQYKMQFEEHIFVVIFVSSLLERKHWNVNLIASPLLLSFWVITTVNKMASTLKPASPGSRS